MKCQMEKCPNLVERGIVWCREHRIQVAAAFGFDENGRSRMGDGSRRAPENTPMEESS